MANNAFAGLRGVLRGMRRANPGERPRFGSVWTWGTQMDYLRLIAIGRVSYRAFDATVEDGVVFMDARTGRMDDQWGWVTDPTDNPETAWYCIDEGSPEAPYV